MFCFPLKTTVTALAALLLAGPLAAQQAPPADATAKATKTKIKTKRSKSSAASQGVPATPALPGPGIPAPAPGLAGPGMPPPPPAGGPAPVGGPGMPPPPLAPGLGLNPGPGGPGPGMMPGGVQALSDFSGTLTQYTAANDDQVYDAFGFKTSTGTDTVRFPRHLGQALMAAAKPGSTVIITGFRDTNPQGRATLHLVSLTSAGQTLRDTPPTPPATPPTEETVTVRSSVQRLAQDPAGRTTAAILADGTVLRLPPAAAAQLTQKLKAGATVAATGTLRAARPGEVAARPVRVVNAQTLTLDGSQFLVR